MPIPKTIWTELWRRVAEREEVGVAIQFTNGEAAKYMLHQHRPPELADFAVCRTPDPDTLFIVRPGFNPRAEADAHAHREIFNDISEPLP